MLTRIQHVAIVSENFVRETRFYEVVLGMKRSKPGSAEEEKAIRTNYALSISDGYVGMTVIGRKPGYVPGLHHFGIDVDDCRRSLLTHQRKISSHHGFEAALQSSLRDSWCPRSRRKLFRSHTGGNGKSQRRLCRSGAGTAKASPSY